MSVIDRSEWILTKYQRLRQFARYAIGRVTGTTTDRNAAYQYFLEAEECRLYYRAELNTLIQLLQKKGVFTAAEWTNALGEEMDVAAKDNHAKWPEIKVAEDGRSYALDPEGFQKRCKEEGWPP